MDVQCREALRKLQQECPKVAEWATRLLNGEYTPGEVRSLVPSLIEMAKEHGFDCLRALLIILRCVAAKFPQLWRALSAGTTGTTATGAGAAGATGGTATTGGTAAGGAAAGGAAFGPAAVPALCAGFPYLADIERVALGSGHRHTGCHAVQRHRRTQRHHGTLAAGNRDQLDVGSQGVAPGGIRRSRSGLPEVVGQLQRHLSAGDDVQGGGGGSVGRAVEHFPVVLLVYALDLHLSVLLRVRTMQPHKRLYVGTQTKL